MLLEKKASLGMEGSERELEEKLKRDKEKSEIRAEASKEVQERILKEIEERKVRKTLDEERNLCQICQDLLFTEDADMKVFALGVCSDVYHVDCILPWIETCIETQ